MSVSYYVAIPFVLSDDGAAPRSGDPIMGEFSDAVVIETFGEVPDRLDEL